MYVVVAGAGHMGTHLVSRLVAAGHETVVIDTDRAVTERLYADQGIVVFTGSATDVNVLDQASIKRADVAVAMTGRDADNLAFCLLARYYGVPRVLARMLNPQYQVPYRLVGATKIHSEADILVESFLTSIEYPEIGAVMLPDVSHTTATAGTGRRNAGRITPSTDAARRDGRRYE